MDVNIALGKRVGGAGDRPGRDIFRSTNWPHMWFNFLLSTTFFLSQRDTGFFLVRALETLGLTCVNGTNSYVQRKLFQNRPMVITRFSSKDQKGEWTVWQKNPENKYQIFQQEDTYCKLRKLTELNTKTVFSLRTW